MVYNEYTLLQILQLNDQGVQPPSIVKHLAAEGIAVTMKDVAKFLKHFLRQVSSQAARVH